jgi:hypothetical protein
MTTKRLGRDDSGPRVTHAVRQLQELDADISDFARTFMDDAAATNVLTTLGIPLTEASWTPALLFGGAATGITYGTQVGRYVRFGPMVYVWATIVLTSNGTATGDATISGLPLAASTVAGLVFVGNLSNYQNLNFSDPYPVGHCTIASAGQVINLRDGDGGAGGTRAMTEAWFDDTATFSVSIMYRTG